MTESQGKEFAAEIKELGDKIVALTLLQARDLAGYLKEVHGIEPAAGAVAMVQTGGAAPGAAAAAAPGRFRSIALLSRVAPAGLIEDTYYTEVWAGMFEAAAGAGQRITVLHLGGEGAREQALRTAEEVPLDGLLVLGTSNRELVKEILDLGLPAVVADHSFEDLPVDCVDIDSEGGSAAAVRHLVALGHRRIGFMANTQPEYNPPRYRGYLRGLAEAGIAPDERLVVRGTPSTEGGYRLMRELLEAGRELPTAYLAYGGTMAVGAMRALEERGLSVPGDLSLAGCGSRWFARANPGITTAVAEAHLLGATAVRTLLERIENPKAAPRQVRLPMELRVAASTGAPRPGGRG